MGSEGNGPQKFDKNHIFYEPIPKLSEFAVCQAVKAQDVQQINPNL